MSILFRELERGTTVETHSRKITEADVVNFAGVSGDFNPIHLSRTAGEASPFGARVVHGGLLFAVCLGLLWQRREPGPETLVLYGADSLRFVAPVEFDTTVHVEAVVVEKRPRDHPIANALIRLDTDLVADEQTVLSCDLLVLVV